MTSPTQSSIETIFKNPLYDAEKVTGKQIDEGRSEVLKMVSPMVPFLVANALAKIKSDSGNAEERRWVHLRSAKGEEEEEFALFKFRHKDRRVRNSVRIPAESAVYSSIKNQFDLSKGREGLVGFKYLSGYANSHSKELKLSLVPCLVPLILDETRLTYDDKKEVWEALATLAQDSNEEVRRSALWALQETNNFC